MRLWSIFRYFVNYKQLTQTDRKYFIIVKETAAIYKRESGKVLRKSAHVALFFFGQLFKCVKIIFSQIYLKTGWRKSQRDKGTAISIFSEYLMFYYTLPVHYLYVILDALANPR